MTRQWTLRVAVSGLALVAGLLAVTSPPRARTGRAAGHRHHRQAVRVQPEPEITLARGETVKLQIKSEDVTHGLFLRPLGIDTEIVPRPRHRAHGDAGDGRDATGPSATTSVAPAMAE